MTPTAGVGFKPRHSEEALAASEVGLWFEVHAENYMVEGGPRLAMLDALRAERPLSLHGVGLSLAGPDLPDPEHLAAFRRLVRRFEPELVSEHMAWSRRGGHCLPDLLPFPRTSEALRLLCRNVDAFQQAIGRAVLIENPSHYVSLDHDWSEPEFLTELTRRTGCELLLDLNNVFVSACNLGFLPEDWLDALPAAAVGEIHLAGAVPDAELDLLIDNHGAPVAQPVWALFERFVRARGPRPTLIEWDRDVPSFSVLMAERNKAATRMTAMQWETANA